MEYYTQRDAVRNVQRYLRALSYADYQITRPPLDGIFEAATENAVREFQSQYGLPTTGRVDKATHDALYNEYLIAQGKSIAAAPSFFPTSPIGYEIHIGERSRTVTVLQILLSELGLVFDTLESSVQSGIYDEETAERVKSFQRLSLLPVTGRVDIETWNRLVRDYSNLYSAL